MAKAKAKSKLNKKSIWLVSIITLILLCSWLFWLRPLQDQAKFERIDRTVTELVNQINDTNSSSTVHDERYCYLAGRVSGPEPIYCKTSRTILTNDKGVSDFASYLDPQSSLIENIRKFGENTYDFNLAKEDGVSCSISPTDNTLSGSNSTNGELDVECFGSAQRAHYGFLRPEESNYNLGQHIFNATLLMYAAVILGVALLIIWAITRIVSKYKLRNNDSR